jgi:hypothetical protein
MSCETKTPPAENWWGQVQARDSETMGVSTARERKAVYIKAYRQQPQVKEREQVRKRKPEYKARQADYMRDYKAWNRVRLSGYEQSRRAAQKERELGAKGEIEFTPYSEIDLLVTHLPKKARNRDPGMEGN